MRHAGDFILLLLGFLTVLPPPTEPKGGRGGGGRGGSSGRSSSGYRGGFGGSSGGHGFLEGFRFAESSSFKRGYARSSTDYFHGSSLGYLAKGRHEISRSSISSAVFSSPSSPSSNILLASSSRSSSGSHVIAVPAKPIRVEDINYYWSQDAVPWNCTNGTGTDCLKARCSLHLIGDTPDRLDNVIFRNGTRASELFWKCTEGNSCCGFDCCEPIAMWLGILSPFIAFLCVIFIVIWMFCVFYGCVKVDKWLQKKEDMRMEQQRIFYSGASTRASAWTSRSNPWASAAKLEEHGCYEREGAYGAYSMSYFSMKDFTLSSMGSTVNTTRPVFESKKEMQFFS